MSDGVTTILHQTEEKDLLRLVTAGSVDDGKSTLIGRLLMESKGVYEDQLDALRKTSARRGVELDLAHLTDGLKAEREQGITIDVAYRYFSTPRRKFIIADCPGHEQYTRNMATGASTANVMVILIDAAHGVMPQSRRHAFIASLLGIPHMVVVVNKMDLVDYSQEVFQRIAAEVTDFSARLEITDLACIPVSALKGDNVVHRSDHMPWYDGPTLLHHLETVHIASDRNLIDLRFPVQYVSRPDAEFRGYMGTMASGVIRRGEEVMAIPSGMRTHVKELFGPDGPCEEAFCPQPTTVTLTDEIDLSRGDMLVHVHNVPHVDHRLETMLVWMSPKPMETQQSYLVKHLTRTVPGEVSLLRYRVDVNTLHRQPAETLALNEIGRCLLTLSRPLAFDSYDRNHNTGALILIDRLTNDTVAAGMILPRDPNEWTPESTEKTGEPKSSHVQSHRSLVTDADRVRCFHHKPTTIWLTGLTGAGKSTWAYGLEKRLFEMGHACRVLDGENMRLGLSRDLGFSATDREENIRRAAEAARLINQAGVLCLCSFVSPLRSGRRNARQIIGEDQFLEIYLSAPLDVCRRRDPKGLYDLAEEGKVKFFSGVSAPYEPPQRPDLILPTHELDAETCLDRILDLLRQRGILLS
jgi:bifunctional enzyme CysN/CysC